MKFSGLILVLLVVSTLLVTSISSSFYLDRMKRAALDYNKKTSAEFFISESFRKTCRGEGFDSLNKWQVVCREMWNLEYIGWGNAEDFMQVDYSHNDRALMYGTWQSDFIEGEVYCRRK